MNSERAGHVSDAGVRLRHVEEVPEGELTGYAHIVVVPPAPELAHAPLLRLVTPRSSAIVSMHRVLGGPGAALTVAEPAREEITPRGRSAHQRILDYALPPGPADGPLLYRVAWDVSGIDPRMGQARAEVLLARVQLAVPADGGDRVLSQRMLRLEWYTPGPGQEIDRLSRLAADDTLPASLTDALANLIEADAKSVPACPYCSLRWEIDLLDVADRLWEEADRHGSTRITAVLLPWTPTTEHRDEHWPCSCPRGRPQVRYPQGTQHVPQRRPTPPLPSQDEVRQRLAAARARHRSRREAHVDPAR
ncbi:hypothetical protein OG900_38925 [Streptomyces sp. NBC_00433]